MMNLFTVLILALIPACDATILMPFNSLEYYIEAARGIWIVQPMRNLGADANGFLSDVKIIQTLKGATGKAELHICSTSRRFALEKKYLVFGFGAAPDGRWDWMDNGQFSPIPLPNGFALDSLKSKSLHDQVFSIISARIKEIDQQIGPDLAEKAAFEAGLKPHECENIPFSTKNRAAVDNWKKGMYFCGLKAYSAGDTDRAGRDWSEILNVDPNDGDAKAGMDQIRSHREAGKRV